MYTENKPINGIFCISLDFEKYWGVHDVTSPEEISERFKKIESIVFSMLQLFEKYEVHVTWATVGLLTHSNLNELIEKNNPEDNRDKTISYQNKTFSPFPISVEKFSKIPFEILSAKKEIDAILKTKNQELSSHTYAHYYTLEKGQTETEFLQDINSMNEVELKLNHKFRSIVFPRNQINSTYLAKLNNYGYVAYRGNQKNKDWSNSTFESESKLKKARRFLDAYFKISKTESTRLEKLEMNEGLYNIPASRFLRPYINKPRLEKRKANRILNEMTKAAQEKTIYHLWWHPHNFSNFPEQSLDQLEIILKHFILLKNENGFESLNMQEIAARAKK